MRSIDLADKFMLGLFWGGFVTLLATVALDYFYLCGDIPHAGTPVMRLAISAGIAAFLIFTRPLLTKAVRRVRRSLYIVDEEINASLRGRALGLIIGLIAGTAVAQSIW